MIDHIKREHRVTGHPHLPKTENFLVHGTFGAKTKKVLVRTEWLSTYTINQTAQRQGTVYGGGGNEDMSKIWQQLFTRTPNISLTL